MEVGEGGQTQAGGKNRGKKIIIHDGPEAPAMDLSRQEVGHVGMRFKLR